MRTDTLFHRPVKLLAVGSLLFAALLAGQTAFAQTISGSRHDLSTRTSVPGTTEVCVFCHTPHGATTGSTSGGLLWNRAAPATAGYTVYTSASLDSTALQPMGNSTMCFSCHDGVTSLDNMVNKPGSGGFTAGGAVTGWTWTPAAGPLTGIFNIGAGPVSALDISNDHPISVAYCGGFTAGACNDPDFKLTAATQQLQRKPLGGVVTSGAAAAVVGALTDQYWIDTITALGSIVTATANIRDKTDMFLYPLAFATPAGIFPSVQCASCHEPHMGITTVANDGLTSFLRRPNAGSALCLSCHTK